MTFLFWSAVIAQQTIPSEENNKAIKVQWTYRLQSAEDGQNFASHLSNWHAYLREQGVYKSGVPMNSFGWLDQTTVK